MPNPTRNVLVTGASGLVGRHLVGQLLRQGDRVRAFVRSPAQVRELESIGCQTVLGDIRDDQKIIEAVSGVQIIVHLAAVLRPWRDATYESVTVGGTHAIVQAARQASVNQFIYISALGVQPGDSNPYMLTKREAEEAVRSSGLNHTIFRPSYLYGKGSHFLALLENLVRLPVVPVVGPGRQKLQLMWVDDLAACIAASIQKESCANQTFEIGGPEALDFNEVLDAVSRTKGSRIRTKIHLPFGLIKPFAAIGAKIISTLPATPDTLELLLRDSTCDVQYVKNTFDVQLVSFTEGLRKVLG